MRSARRGAAAGVSGMTTDHQTSSGQHPRHAFVAPDGRTVSHSSHPPRHARHRPPRKIDCIAEATRGRERRNSNVIRRLVGRTMAQQLSEAVEASTAPHQHALSSRAGTECDTFFRSSQRWIPKPRSCRSMGWERTIPSRERRCSRY